MRLSLCNGRATAPMASANSTCAANRTIDLRKGHPKPSNLPNARIMMAMAMASKRLEANQLSLQYPSVVIMACRT